VSLFGVSAQPSISSRSPFDPRSVPVPFLPGATGNARTQGFHDRGARKTACEVGNVRHCSPAHEIDPSVTIRDEGARPGIRFWLRRPDLRKCAIHEEAVTWKTVLKGFDREVLRGESGS
jgi:hypothetical protein